MRQSTITSVQAPHCLYRFRSHNGELLYVGITNDPSRRISQHAASKPWWIAVARIDLEHFTTLNEARSAEERAIRVEQPTHNFQHNGQAYSKPKDGVRRCLRCRGTGTIAKYRHHKNGGMCFACKGVGHFQRKRRDLIAPVAALIAGITLVFYAAEDVFHVGFRL